MPDTLPLTAGRIGTTGTSGRPRPGGFLSDTPLLRPALLAGLVAGATAGVLLESLLSGILVLSVLLVGALAWPRGEAPGLCFCLMFQGLSVSAGFLYYAATGRFPGMSFIGDIEGAVVLVILSFFATTLGYRYGSRWLRRHLPQRPWARAGAPMDHYPVAWLAGAAIALVLVDWILGFEMNLAAGTTQIRKTLLGLRVLVFWVLFVEVLQQKRGWSWALAAAGTAVFAQMSSEMSGFTEVFIIFFIAALTSWRPGTGKDGSGRVRLLPLVTVGVSAILLGSLAFWWTGYAKPIWRVSVREGAAGKDSVERSLKFVETFRVGKTEVDYEALPARLSSGLAFTSLVLERVPRSLPYEQGLILRRALMHVTRPRFLFPEKGDLGGDSWLVMRYAGVTVADESTGTSIGLGYATQFYIDFGYPGVVALSFALGLLIAAVLEALRALSPSPLFYGGAATMILLGNFRNYDGELAKILGGLITQSVVIGVVLKFPGRPIHDLLTRRSLA
ncbi:MAG: hypothetical protein L0323_05480 [Planctomycetes bacterium]|nr:hypothetical protein [Planctomycetota bacterium]